MDSNYAELPTGDHEGGEIVVELQQDAEDLTLTGDESMVAMASRREAVSRMRRKYFWVTLASVVLIIFPIAMGKLCEGVSHEPLWDDDGSVGGCGGWVWVFFVTCPMGIIMMIVGWLVLLCKGLRSL
mmetsp:Transcript_6366/g.17332  ORF Transcript_6366/g.17332 Transcript_6366/m.17332 type:complete len:127 (-) Transcript_6366:191-571(-)|eukprot:CAMPEP_0198108438 /NCGR_PEP_ID=MMETSP1442-20131203/478_1 /TAXON_ID= /ORGANISM="Craspedostauros australis, Strain CCMP3328" /LENGTH=126 /DNA_ID=CAMNT_0043763703 /DNA_START=329 /DNA_END=709 /DNA_ORIENTATION=+